MFALPPVLSSRLPPNDLYPYDIYQTLRSLHTVGLRQLRAADSPTSHYYHQKDDVAVHDLLPHSISIRLVLARKPDDRGQTTLWPLTGRT